MKRKPHTTSSTDELPPHSEAVEKAVLGAILSDPATAADRIRRLSADDFYTTAALTVFRAVVDLVEDGRPPEMLLLTDHLELTDRMKDAGGIAVVAGLPDLAPAASSFDTFLPELKDWATRREMNRIGSAIMSASRNGADYAEDIGRALELLEVRAARGDAPKPLAFADFTRPPENDPNELIQDHYLNRTGSLLINAATGVGKSVIENQLSVSWCLGRRFLGMDPRHPLRIVTFQAENADADLGYNRDGIFEALQLAEHEIAMVRERYWIVRHSGRTGAEFVRHDLEPILRDLKPDLFWLDPLFAFAGCDVKDQASMTYFLRGLIQPTLIRYNCASAATHHTNKPPTDKATHRRGWTSFDYAYTGSGSIELSNWARAIIHFEPAGEEGLFRVAYGKRGSRLFSRVQFIRQSGSRDLPSWHECDAEEAKKAEEASAIGQERSVVGMLLAKLPIGERVRRTEVDEQWAGILKVTRGALRNAIEHCEEHGYLERMVERKGKTRVAYLLRTHKEHHPERLQDEEPFDA